MLKSGRTILSVVATLLTLAVASPALADSSMEDIVKTGKMTIAVQTQGPPVSFIDRNGDRTGLAIELARMMADDMEVELVVQDYDWKGLIPSLTSGKADFIAADMTPTAKRAMQIVFTEPVFYSETVAFAKKDKGFTRWEDIESSGASVGATQASSWSGTARRMMPGAELKEYAGGTAQTVQAVTAGRVDSGLSDKATIATFVNADPSLVVLDGVLAKEPLSFAVRPDSLHLLEALDNYMRLIALDGRLQQKIDYWWNTTDWEADHK